MADPRITREAVLATIYGRANRRRVIWTASTTLTAMEIERYPHIPHGNYRKMTRLLRELCDDGLLILRPRLHSNFTMKEIAYERAVDAAAGPRRLTAATREKSRRIDARGIPLYSAESTLIRRKLT